jgi:hypothetical protein
MERVHSVTFALRAVTSWAVIRQLARIGVAGDGTSTALVTAVSSNLSAILKVILLDRRQPTKLVLIIIVRSAARVR